MKPGDYVIWTDRVDRWRTNAHWGSVLEISSAGVLKIKLFNKPDEPKVFRPRKNGAGYKDLRPATDDEIKRRRWRNSRPKPVHLGAYQTALSHSQNWYISLADEFARHEADPAKLREAAAEMIAIADWLEKEPT